MRDSVFANKVACPIKIGEYLACGLPVILTKGIGDFDALINQAGIGVLIGDNEQAAQQAVNFMQAPDFSQLRNKAVEFCKKHLSYESHLEKYQRLFRC
jgi:glycosyltransferase involved in cell wall biosynthesis